MISVYLGKIAKRTNSTFVPDTSAMTVTTGELNQDFLLTAPQIFFELPVNKAPVYNYAYIPDFNRYYFITAWNFTAGLWLADMTVDVLASYKTQIGKETLYILRSAAAFNGDVPDTKYPMLASRNKVVNTRASIFSGPTLNSSGTYVIGVVNSSANAGNSRFGAVEYYQMNRTQIADFMSSLFGDIDYMNVDTKDLSEGLQTMLINPFQYVVSAMWFPIDMLQYDAVMIRVGWWKLNTSAPRLGWNQSTLDFRMTVPKHPQTGALGNWVNQAPYTTYNIEFWPFGVIPLDSAKLVNVDELLCTVKVDHITGVGTLRIADSATGILISSSTAQIGVPLQLAQLSVDYGRLQGTTGTALTLAGASAITGLNAADEEKPVKIGTLMDSIKAGASAAWSGLKAIATGQGKDVVQSVASTAADIGNAAASILADMATTGGNGGRASFTYDIVLNMFYSNIAQGDNDHNGKPLCQLRKISTLSGFVKCNSGDIAISGATRGELELIKAYLEGGFFYE